MKDFKGEIRQPIGEGTVSNVADFGMNEANADNYQAFCEALAYCKKHKVNRLLIPRGTYHFTTPAAVELDRLSDFVIEGEEAELIYSNPMDFLHFSNCDTVLVKGIRIDWDWEKQPLASVVEVLEFSEQKDYVDFKIIGDQLPGPDQNWVTMNAMNPDTMTVGKEGGIEFGVYKNDCETFDKKQWLGGHCVRCYKDMQKVKAAHFQPGNYYLVRHFLYNGAAVQIADCCHLTFEDVVIYSGSGTGYVVKGHTHHLFMDHCKIALRPDTQRRITTTADGFHVAQSNGYLLFEWCDFGFHGDDCINIHDNVKMYIEVPDAYTIRVKGFFQAQPGDVIELRNGDLSPLQQWRTVKKVVQEAAATELVFDEVLPELQADTVLFNRAYGSDHYLIRDCYFHETRARGVLAQANHGLIENCRFYRIQGAAIQIETGASRTWSEGMGVDDLVIRGNTIEHCDANDWGKAVIYMSTFLPEGIPLKYHGSPNPTTTLGDSGSSYRTSYPMFTNIEISRNLIKEYPRRAMILSSFDGVTVKGNTFVNEQAWKKNNPERGSIWVELGKNAVFKQNDYQKSPYTADQFVEVDDVTTQNIVVR